jgi:Zn-dependent metalloprotease
MIMEQQLITIVHYGDAYDNAFWNGTAMTYGDEVTKEVQILMENSAPLTSLDVCGHEIGHGVCEYCRFSVSRESGAMNEGFLISGCSVENFVLVGIDATHTIPWELENKLMKEMEIRTW